jgi:hypothetical protein
VITHAQPLGGDGRWLRAFLEQHPTCTAKGIELNEELIARARENLEEVTFVDNKNLMMGFGRSADNTFPVRDVARSVVVGCSWCRQISWSRICRMRKLSYVISFAKYEHTISFASKCRFEQLSSPLVSCRRGF